MLTQPKTAITSILPAGERSSLARCLRDFAARAQDLCYVPNVGNVGDALIASGAWQFFDAIGLRPRIVHATRVSKGASVIYAGGGNLTPFYQNCARFLRRCMAVDVKEGWCYRTLYEAMQIYSSSSMGASRWSAVTCQASNGARPRHPPLRRCSATISRCDWM